jgi:hypothetical protein
MTIDAARIREVLEQLDALRFANARSGQAILFRGGRDSGLEDAAALLEALLRVDVAEERKERHQTASETMAEARRAAKLGRGADDELFRTITEWSDDELFRVISAFEHEEVEATAEPPIRPNDDPPEQVRAREEAERRHAGELSADAGEVERLAREEAERRFGSHEMVIAACKRSAFTQGALWFAALRPAPTEEQVERAAAVARAVWHGEEFLPWELLDAEVQDEWAAVARAILAVGPAPQAGAGR